MHPITITNISVFLTAPDGQNLVVVKVDTSQLGLFGLGCATLAYRAFAVKHVIENSLAPLLLGRDTAQTEELWRLMHYNAYWRSGPVINNAISGVDMALWDIKAKRAGMPLYDLLGGKCRTRVTAYLHCNDTSQEAILEQARQAVANGCRCVRAGFSNFDGPGGNGGYLCLGQTGRTYDPQRYCKQILSLMTALREMLGDDVGLITDVHERLDPPDVIRLARNLEELNLFFLEDPLPPEQMDWFERLRQKTVMPLAMGESFTHMEQAAQLIEKRRVDYIRCHLSSIGGLTPARKLGVLGECFGVKTAWHGSLDMSPIALASAVHLDYALPNFGIQEYYGYGEQTALVFPGTPACRDGALWLNEAPGHGVDFNEREAQRYLPKEDVTYWTEMRTPDGALHAP